MTNLKPDKGKFLISAPHLTDVFKRTVIYIVEHNENGTVGFIINKPLRYKINEVIDEFPEFETRAFLGGPVQTELINFIHKTPEILEGGYEIENGIYWGGNFETMKLLIESNKLNPDDFRFFVGYSGWSSGQLEDELKVNSWYVVNASEKYIFYEEPEKMWQNLLRELGGEYAVISTFPEDPMVN